MSTFEEYGAFNPVLTVVKPEVVYLPRILLLVLRVMMCIHLSGSSCCNLWSKECKYFLDIGECLHGQEKS